MDYTDYTAPAQAEAPPVSGLEADPFTGATAPSFTGAAAPSFTGAAAPWADCDAANYAGVNTPGAVRANATRLRGAGFAMPLPNPVWPNPVWRAALARRLWAIVRGMGTEPRNVEPATLVARLAELAAMFQQVEADFERGLVQAFVAQAGAEAVPDVESPALCASYGPGAAPRKQPDERTVRAANLNQWFCALYAQAGRTLVRTLLPELRRAGLGLQAVAGLDAARRACAEQQFLRRIFPVLTPLAVDPAHPFPYIAGGSTNLLFEIQTPEQAARHSASSGYARVEIPLNRPSLLNIATADAPATEWVWTADLLRHLAHFLFPGMVVRNSYLFRVLRAPASETAAEVEAEPAVRQTGRREARRHAAEWGGNRPRSARRLYGPPVIRLEVASDMPDCVVQWLTRHLDAPLHGLVRVDHAQEIFGLGGLLPVAEQLWGGEALPEKPVRRPRARRDAVRQPRGESSESHVPLRSLVGQV